MCSVLEVANHIILTRNILILRDASLGTVCVMHVVLFSLLKAYGAGWVGQANPPHAQLVRFVLYG